MNHNMVAQFLYRSSLILMLWGSLLHVLPLHADPLYEVNQLVKKGKTDQALDQINSYLSSQHKDAWGRTITQMRFLKGLLLAEKNKTNEAIQVFTKLTQDYPDLPETWNNLAILQAKQGRLEEARDTLERGLKTDTAYATSYRNLNEIYARLATQAYDHTLKASQGERPAPALIKDLCDNYGHLANQAVGRQQIHDADITLLRDIPKSRSSASAPPQKIDVDEMALETSPAENTLPPAFIDPGTHKKETPKSVVSPTATAPELTPTKALPIPETHTDEEKQILSVVNNWATAWSSKNVGAYLNFYAKDFRPPGGQSRAEWNKLRHERINKPKSIKVTVETPNFKFTDSNHVVVSFRQGYRSDNLSTSTKKSLLMTKQGGKWQIAEERT